MLEKKKFKYLLMICMLLFSQLLHAQNRITGILSNVNNQPVNGATISIKGTNIAVQSDATGAFSIPVSNANSILTISSVGYQTRDVNVGNQSSISLVLQTATSNLDEVLVTGYSTQRRKDITGSVAVVNVKDLKAVPAGSPEQMLQGRASGLNIITSGQPGSSSNIRIRGITSFGNSDPLVIIDGVQGSLTNINVNDIESVQVLKDAGAASIYGVRGSNGVIVVTTKKGKSGKATITYDGYYGTQRPSKKGFDLLNPQQTADLTWLAYRNSGEVDSVTGNPVHPQYGSGATPILPDYILPSGAFEGDPAVNPALYNIDFGRPYYQIVKANKQGTDWFHEIFKPAPTQSHTITASGGSNKSTYLFSLGYLDQQGTVIETYLKRYSARMNTMFNVKDNIRIGENAYFFYRNNPQITNLGDNSEIANAYYIQPIVPVYDIAGNYGGTAGSRLGVGGNPVAMRMRAKDDRGNQWDVQGNVFAEVDFLKHFTARTSFGGTLNLGYASNFLYRTYEQAENNGQNSYSESAYYNRSWTWTNSITYSNVFAEKHNVKIFAATEGIENYGRNLGGNGVNLFSNDPNYRNLSNVSPGGNLYSGAYQNSIFSLIGRVDYSYNEKYLLSATVRRDGSSVFGPEKRYGVFPSVTAGWRISSEEFMKNVSWINDLKIRGGYGILGSQANVSPTNAYTLFRQGGDVANYDITGSNNSAVRGFLASSLGNKNTGWEEDKITNIGVDATLFNNKIDFSVEWYKKSIKGLLFQQPLPSTAGGSDRPYVNIGNITNSGIDLNITYRGKVNKDFSYDVGVIFTSYNSNITSVPGGYFNAGAESRIGKFVRNQTGHPIGSFFGYKVLGIFQTDDEVSKSPTQEAAAPGRFKYADINGDNTITDADRTFFGNPNPDFTYGLNLGASFKRFDFSAFFYGSQGNDVLNLVRWWTDFFQSSPSAKSQAALYNSWSPTNTGGTTPKAETQSNFSNNAVQNSYYLEDGSYLRCKSVILGYTFPTGNLNRFGIDRLRVYAQVANLFTITKYSGLDPELSGSNSAFGMDFGNYPNNQKNYNIGVSVSF